MKPMLKVSAAALFAAVSVVPALAATAPAPAAPVMGMATITQGSKADIAAVSIVDKLIGKWTKAELLALDKASAVTVFNTKTLYDPADLKLLDATVAKKTADLGKLHAALEADAALKAWLTKNSIDANSVVLVTEVHGKVHVFTD